MADTVTTQDIIEALETSGIDYQIIDPGCETESVSIPLRDGNRLACGPGKDSFEGPLGNGIDITYYLNYADKDNISAQDWRRTVDGLLCDVRALLESTSSTTISGQ
jgi:hypothetical protein